MPGRHEDDDADGLIAPELRLAYVNPDDLSAYERIDPVAFENWDAVDSTTVVDDGYTPPDAA